MSVYVLQVFGVFVVGCILVTLFEVHVLNKSSAEKSDTRNLFYRIVAVWGLLCLILR